MRYIASQANSLLHTSLDHRGHNKGVSAMGAGKKDDWRKWHIHELPLGMPHYRCRTGKLLCPHSYNGAGIAAETERQMLKEKRKIQHENFYNQEVA